ncbi:MAG: hypothetical protein AB8A49_09225 [Prochlorococcus sp.]
MLQQNPDEAVAWNYVCKFLLALGQFEQSKNCLSKAH